MSPTQRTKAALKGAGTLHCIAEHWNAFARIRQDLFGFIDIVALGPGIRGIQCTTDSNMSARVAKIKGLPAALEWLNQGGKIEVWGWGKHGPRGKRKTWQVRVREITAGEFEGLHDRLEGYGVFREE